MTTDLYQQETVTLRACAICGREMVADDRFCRRCGAHQHTRVAVADPQPTRVRGNAGSMPLATAPVTTTLRAHPSLCLVSGSLVVAIAEAVSANAAPSIKSRSGQRVLLGLISLPIWLLIILLSPLDAYLAAKAVCR